MRSSSNYNGSSNIHILSAFDADNLCAIISVVLLLDNFSTAFLMASSLSSREEVAYPRRIGVSLKIALAIAILCFCPQKA